METPTNSWLPSKRFAGMLLALLLLVVLYFLARGVFQLSRNTLDVSNGEEAEELTIDERDDLLLRIVQEQTIDSIDQLDTDGDGLYDWEEALWGTAVDNPDTDGDGVSDAQYVAAQKKALNDSSLDDGEPLDDLDIFSRDIYTTYQYLKETGQLTAENTEALQEQIALSIFNAGITEPYTDSDISTVFPDETGLWEYLQELDQILNSYGALPLSDIETLLEPIETGVVGPEVEEVLTGLREYELALLAAAVPQNYTTEHLVLTNAVKDLIQTLENISFWEVDPVKGLSGIARVDQVVVSYQESLAAMEPVIREIQSTITQ